MTYYIGLVSHTCKAKKMKIVFQYTGGESNFKIKLVIYGPREVYFLSFELSELDGK